MDHFTMDHLSDAKAYLSWTKVGLGLPGCVFPLVLWNQSCAKMAQFLINANCYDWLKQFSMVTRDIIGKMMSGIRLFDVQI